MIVYVVLHRCKISLTLTVRQKRSDFYSGSPSTSDSLSSQRSYSSTCSSFSDNSSINSSASLENSNDRIIDINKKNNNKIINKNFRNYRDSNTKSDNSSDGKISENSDFDPKNNGNITIYTPDKTYNKLSNQQQYPGQTSPDGKNPSTASPCNRYCRSP